MKKYIYTKQVTESITQANKQQNGEGRNMISVMKMNMQEGVQGNELNWEERRREIYCEIFLLALQS